jgi:hypothetical protein
VSIEAIEAIEKFITRRDVGTSLAEVKAKVQAFIDAREKNEEYNGPRRYGYVRRNYVVREGREIPRDKLK